MKPGVVLVCATYPPVIGGSETEAQRVCAALIRRGYQVTVVCAGGPPMPPVRNWVDPEGVPVRIYAPHRRGTAFQHVVFTLEVAAMLVRERRHYEIVYFLMPGLQLMLGMPVARWFRKAILVKIGGSGIISLMTRSALGRLQLRWIQRWVFRLMILNDGMKQEALEQGFRPHQIYWMPNPIDTDAFAPCDAGTRARHRAEFGIPPAAPVAIYTGRLSEEKGLSMLVRAFALVLNQVPAAILILVGDGALRASLMKEAEQAGIAPDHIRFTGQMDPKQVLPWLQVADVFTLVSPNEGFSCSLAEAMATGLPSVVSNIPANWQLVDDHQHGLLVPPDRPDDIAGAIAALLTDPAQRARMGSLARERIVRNYSTGKVATRYEELFAQALSARDEPASLPQP